MDATKVLTGQVSKTQASASAARESHVLAGSSPAAGSLIDALDALWHRGCAASHAVLDPAAVDPFHFDWPYW